jgi:hypothetical protein
MPETVLIPTTTRITYFVGSTEIFTFFNDIDALPNILSVEIMPGETSGTDQGVPFLGGDLLVRVKNYPIDINAFLNTQGEFIIEADDSDSYFIDNNAELRYAQDGLFSGDTMIPFILDLGGIDEHDFLSDPSIAYSLIPAYYDFNGNHFVEHLGSAIQRFTIEDSLNEYIVPFTAFNPITTATIGGTGVVQTGNSFTATLASAATATWSNVLKRGRMYTITFNITNYSQGEVQVGNDGVDMIANQSTGTIKHYVAISDDLVLTFDSQAGGTTLDIQIESVQEVGRGMYVPIADTAPLVGTDHLQFRNIANLLAIELPQEVITPVLPLESGHDLFFFKIRKNSTDAGVHFLFKDKISTDIDVNFTAGTFQTQLNAGGTALNGKLLSSGVLEDVVFFKHKDGDIDTKFWNGSVLVADVVPFAGTNALTLGRHDMTGAANSDFHKLIVINGLELTDQQILDFIALT